MRILYILTHYLDSSVNQANISEIKHIPYIVRNLDYKVKGSNNVVYSTDDLMLAKNFTNV